MIMPMVTVTVMGMVMVMMMVTVMVTVTVIIMMMVTVTVMVRMLVILMVMVRANLSTWSSAAHVGFALLVRCPNQKFSESQNLLSKKYKLRMPSSLLNPTESDKMKKNDLPRQIRYQNRKGKPFMFWVAFLKNLCDLLSKECKLQQPSTPVNPSETDRI